MSKKEIKRTQFNAPAPTYGLSPKFKTSSLTWWPKQCVQVAKRGNRILVKDSKIERSPVLSFTEGEWDAFIGGVKNGEFDLK